MAARLGVRLDSLLADRTFRQAVGADELDVVERALRPGEGRGRLRGRPDEPPPR
jgi:hypothetical protein